MREQETIARCLEHLRALPFAEQVDVTVRPTERYGVQPALELRLVTPGREWRFQVEVKTAHLTYAVAEGNVRRALHEPDHPWILFARYIPRRLGEFLTERGLCFVDEVGNCHIELGRDHLAHVEGRPQPRDTARGRGMGIAGYKLLFALLADPNLLDLPIRQIATEAGVGKTAVAHTLNRLEEEGLIGKGLKRRHVLEIRPILDRWLVGFETFLCPRLRIGTFRTPDPDPPALEKRVEKVLGAKHNWAWGGGAAAMRLTRYYRGENTVLYIDQPEPDLRRRLKALPARDGTLTLLRPPGKIAFRGAVPNTVHPLLVYTDLLVDRDERARDTAAQIAERFLEYLA